MTKLRTVLLGSTALLAIGLAAGTAATQDAVPVNSSQFGYNHKAVGEASFALGVFGGGDENGLMLGAMPSFTAPLGDKAGIQVDGAAGIVAKNEGFAAVGGQLFFRDPQAYLFGVAVGGYYVDGSSRYSVSAVAEAYMNDVTLEGQAGYLFGDGKKSAFGRVGASVYATPNLRLGAGLRYDRLTKLGGDVQAEAMLEDVPGMTLFGVAAFDKEGAMGIGGLKFYFNSATAGRGKQAGGVTLQEIQRSLVARNFFMLDPVSSLRQISQVAAGDVNGLGAGRDGNGGGDDDDDDDDNSAETCTGSGLGTDLCTSVTDTTDTVNDLIAAVSSEDPTGQTEAVTTLLQQLVSDVGTLVGTTPSPLLNGVPELLSSLQGVLNDPTNPQSNLAGVVGQVATILDQTIDAVQAGAIDSQNNENLGLLANAVDGLIGLGESGPVPIPADQLSVLTAFIDAVGIDGGNPDGTDPAEAQSVVDGIQQTLGLVLGGVSGQIANPDPTAFVGLAPALQTSLTGTLQPLLNFGTALGVPGGSGLPIDSLDATTLSALLGGLGGLSPDQAGGLSGTLGALAPEELTGLVDGLQALTPAQVTDLLGTLGGLGTANPSGVAGVLGTLGALGVSDPTGLTGVLTGLGGLEGDPLSGVLGSLGTLSPTQLTSLVGGLSSLDPTDLDSVLGSLGGLGGASPAGLTNVLGTLGALGVSDPTGLTGVLTGLGGLEGDPLSGVLGSLGTLSPTQLTSLVGGLSSLDPTDLSSVLGGLGAVDPATLTGLLGGLGGLDGDPLAGLLGGLGGLAPDQLTSVLDGLALQDPTDLLNVLSGLGSIASTDPSGLTAILGGLGGLDGDPLNGLLGGLGGLDPSQVTSILTGISDQDPLQLVDSLINIGNLLGG